MNQYNQWLFRSPSKRLASFAGLIRRSVPEDASRILDIGCGNGVLVSELAELFSQSSLVGVDLSEPNIRLARETHEGKGISFVATDYLRFSDQPFDLIVSYSTINLLPVEQERLLKKIADDLKKGGLLIISMPHDGLYNRLLILLRRALRLVRCEFVDRLIYTIGRLLTPQSISDELILQNVGYMYIVPTHVDGGSFRSAAHNMGLDLVQVEAEKASSIAKLRHRVLVFRKT